ncbi:MAG: VOC family protein [Alphaproteobacteria bacterium]|nr:MAG: VOC family protein [Alphaproteobacteria bacterium]
MSDSATVVPILKVRDLDRALAFYQTILDAAVAWRYAVEPGQPNPAYAEIRLMGARLHLSSFAGDGAFGTAVYLYCADVDDLAARLDTMGDAWEHGPVDQPWGMRELYLRDPDNNQLRLGSQR